MAAPKKTGALIPGLTDIKQPKIDLRHRPMKVITHPPLTSSPGTVYELSKKEPKKSEGGKKPVPRFGNKEEVKKMAEQVLLKTKAPKKDARPTYVKNLEREVAKLLAKEKYPRGRVYITLKDNLLTVHLTLRVNKTLGTPGQNRLSRDVSPIIYRTLRHHKKVQPQIKITEEIVQ